MECFSYKATVGVCGGMHTVYCILFVLKIFHIFAYPSQLWKFLASFCDKVFKLCGVGGNHKSFFRNEGKYVKQQKFLLQIISNILFQGIWRRATIALDT